MIQKYRFGTPFPTESVVKELEITAGTLPYLTVSEGDSLSFSYRMDADDAVYRNWARMFAASTSAAGSTAAKTATNPATPRKKTRSTPRITFSLSAVSTEPSACFSITAEL